MNIRQPAVAGSFYPAEKTELENMIKKFLAKAKNFGIKPKCLIVPHAGYVYSGPVAAVGYKQLQNLEQEKWKIILLGPSHYYPFAGVAFAKYKEWGTPFGSIKTIEPKPSNLIVELTEAHEPEHCLEVQLPFLQTVIENFEILPLITGEVEPKELAKELSNYIDKSTLLIISSDLSHYHSYEEAKKIDSLANAAIPKLDLAKAEKIEACGKTAILTAMHIAKKFDWSGHFLDYRNSGDTAGPKDQVVGYGAYAFTK
jgi:AmmeMemoRadiSam system protein B